MNFDLKLRKQCVGARNKVKLKLGAFVDAARGLSAHLPDIGP